MADKLLAAALFCKKGSLALYLVCRASGDGMESWQPEEIGWGLYCMSRRVAGLNLYRYV